MKPVAIIKVAISGHCYNSGILTVVSTLHNEEKSTDRILPVQSLSGQLYSHAGQHLLRSLPNTDAHRLHQHVTADARSKYCAAESNTNFMAIDGQSGRTVTILSSLWVGEWAPANTQCT